MNIIFLKVNIALFGYPSIFAFMAKNSSSINTDFIISFFLPDGMIDWFEVVNIKEEPNRGTAQADV